MEGKGQSEKQFQTNIIRLAKTYGWLSYHTKDSRGSSKGFPDLTLVKSPHVVFAELKSEKGTLTKEQKIWKENLVECADESPYLHYFVWKVGEIPLQSILDFLCDTGKVQE